MVASVRGEDFRRQLVSEHDQVAEVLTEIRTCNAVSSLPTVRTADWRRRLLHHLKAVRDDGILWTEFAGQKTQTSCRDGGTKVVESE